MKQDLRKRLGGIIVPAVFILILVPTVAYALDGKIFNAEGGRFESVPDARLWADTIWTTITAMLVFFMQAGFAMVEGGFTRAKNTANIMMKNFMDFAMGSLAYWLIGFGIMFGNGNLLFGETGFFVMPATGQLYDALNWTSVPTLTAWFFQLVFAATAATIVSGAMAERTRFISYLVYSFFISLIFYPVVGHWIWGGGWLASLGMLDFAGSTVVHSVGGWFALIGAIMLGPRLGKYDKSGKALAIPGHNLAMATLGTFILWFGWFGFNPGSTMAADVEAISLTATTTNLAAAAGGIGATIASWMIFKKPDLSMALNGALAGLVAVTCACAFVDPWVAIVFFGFVPGIVVVLSVLFFDKIKIDDPVGAISVHGVCGSLGTILLGFFHTKRGFVYSGTTDFLLVQVVGVVSVFAFCVVGALILFGLIKATIGLRVSEEEEIEGLDINEHGNIAYPDFVSTMSGISKSFGSGSVAGLAREHDSQAVLLLAPQGSES